MIRSEDLGDRVLLLTIDRDERRNALDIEHIDELHDLLEAGLGRGARAVVVTGAGSVFSAGADLDGVYGDEFRTALYRALGALRNASVPVIAALNGPAIGAGALLAIACDLRVGGDRARFAVPTARNGLAVDAWTVRRLALLTNGAVARNLLLGAGTLPSDDALRLGLLSRSGDLEVAVAWAREIAEMAPLSLAYSKKTLDRLFESSRGDETELDELFDQCWHSDDVAEGRRAREEGREPVFQGR